MKKIIILNIALLMSLFLFSCAQTSDVAKAITSIGNNGEIGTGATSNPDAVDVVSGKIVVKTVNGKVTVNSTELTLVSIIGNLWMLADGVNITLTDKAGNIITVTVVIDQLTSAISLIPSSPLDSDSFYTLNLSVTVNGVVTNYVVKVIVSVDNTNEANSFFAGITLNKTSGTFNVKDTLKDGKSYFGWEFLPRFNIWLTGLESGAYADLTFYGVYDETMYKDMVFYQRWIGSQEPVKNYKWFGGQISVDETDSSIDGPETDYSFKKTYLEMKVYDSLGNDITSSSNAVINISTY